MRGGKKLSENGVSPSFRRVGSLLVVKLQLGISRRWHCKFEVFRLGFVVDFSDRSQLVVRSMRIQGVA